MKTALFLAIPFLFSCASIKTGINDYTVIHDTIYRIDTTITIQPDTVLISTKCRDTVIIKETLRTSVKTVVKDGIVKVECISKGQVFRVFKDIAVRSVNRARSQVIFRKEKYVPAYIWVIMGILSLPALIGLITLVRRIKPF